VLQKDKICLNNSRYSLSATLAFAIIDFHPYLGLKMCSGGLITRHLGNEWSAMACLGAKESYVRSARKRYRQMVQR
jgi:hypothetical protein